MTRYPMAPVPPRMVSEALILSNGVDVFSSNDHPEKIPRSPQSQFNRVYAAVATRTHVMIEKKRSFSWRHDVNLF